MASIAIALVVAALAFGVSSSVLGPKSAIAQHLGFDLTSGSSSFTITSSIYPSPACSGSTALLYPGTPRCMVFSVHNNLSVPISVGSITSALDTTDYPAPSPACAGSNLTLPTYSGSLAVPANGDASSPGVPIELNDNGSNQDTCQSSTYHFTYSGLANYTDSTTTTLTATPNPSSSSQSVTFTATVTETNASIDPSGPTGTVTFYSCTSNTCGSTTSLGTGSVGSNGQATFSTSSLPVGTDYIEAVYGGSGSNLTGSTSNVLTQTVTSSTLSTSTSLASSLNPSTDDSSVTFTATVSSSSGTPTGTVTFYGCTTSGCTPTTVLGTGTLNSSGKATLATSSLPVGTTYIVATYGASGNYLGSSSSPPLAQVVNPLGTTSSLASSANPSTYGSSVTFTDTVSAATGTPSGSVTFYSCTTNACSTKTSLGTGTLASGRATYSMTSLPVGTTYVEAAYGASGNYGGSTSNAVTQVVNALSTTSSLTSSPNPSTYNTSVIFTDTVSAGSGTPSGTVTFYSCTTSACGSMTQLGTGILSGGKATYSMSSLSVGTTYVEAIYGATGNDGGSTSNAVAQVVNVASTGTSLTSSANPSSYGSAVSFTATVSSGAGTPAGSVAFYSCTTSACSSKTSLGTGTLSGGKATYSTSALPVGTTNVEAIFATSGNYGASTSNVVTQVVSPASTASSLTSAPNPSSFGGSVTFSATVSSGAGTPSGSVTFYSCTTNTCSTKTSLGSGTLFSGTATYSTANLPAGTTYVVAVFGASGNYGGSSSNVVTQVVNPVSTISSLTSAPNPSTFGGSVTLSATVSSGVGTPSGTVTFYSCTTNACSTKTSLGTGTLSAGKATYSTSALLAGTTYVEAIYGASGNYGGSTSNVVGQVVNAAATTTSLTSAPNPSTFGGSVTFSATVSSGAGSPSGSVSYYACTTNTCSTKTSLGSGTLSAGMATYTTSSLPAGTTYVVAVFGASGNYGTSTSNVVTQVVVIVPAVCPASGYSNYVVGTSPPQALYGSIGNDFISAFGGTYWIEGFSGNDCIDAGDGNNDIYEGDGSDGVLAGNGANDVFLGNGNDKVSLGNGTEWVQVGSGNDAITLGNGWSSFVVVGNGTDTVNIGSGSYNEIEFGSGNDIATITGPGSRDLIVGGSGNETVYLGSGIYNTYTGVKGKTNICYLPTPPSSWHGTVADYYHDTITNCTVVSP
jgi:hypothetical protein